MYTRVTASLVGFSIARVDLAVEKFVPGVVEVGLVRVWVERRVKHIASVAAWFATIVARVDLAVVVVDLTVGSFALVVVQRDLTATKVSLAATGAVLAATKVLE